MTLEKLQYEMILARKNKDKLRTTVISEMIDSVRKAAIPKSQNDIRPEITEQFVDNVLLKFQKTIKEMVDTCPADRTETLENYKEQLKITNEFVPALITDEAKIKAIVTELVSQSGVELTKSNHGAVMKIIAPQLKGKADMSIVNKVVGLMLR